MKTISQPAFTGICLRISLSKRFTLFLTTALPTRRLTVKPYLDMLSPLGTALNTITLSDQEAPLSYTREYCAFPVRYFSAFNMPYPVAKVHHYTTVSLYRPFSLLDFNTARPPRVLILARKPCSRFLGILLG